MVLIFRFDRLISQLEQMGLRGEKIEDKALARGGEPIRKAISEIAPRSDSPKKQQKRTVANRTTFG